MSFKEILSSLYYAYMKTAVFVQQFEKTNLLSTNYIINTFKHLAFF